MSDVIITGNVITLANGKGVGIKAIDARSILVDVHSAAYLTHETNEEGDITLITIENDLVIELGDKIEVKVGNVLSIYKIEYMLISKGEKSILLYSSLPTKTSTFLLPLLNKTKKTLKFNSYFVNAFLDNTFTNICLLYRFTGTELYKDFEAAIMKEPLFIKHIEYDPYHVMYVFKIPKQFESDVKCFQEGKYSGFSKLLRERIWKFYGKEEGSAVLQVVKKNKELKKKMEELLNIELSDEAELASKPELDKEIYNIN
jgi:hypothetical protein